MKDGEGGVDSRSEEKEYKPPKAVPWLFVLASFLDPEGNGSD